MKRIEAHVLCSYLFLKSDYMLRQDGNVGSIRNTSYLFFGGQVVGDIEHSADFFWGLAFDHVRHGSTA